MLYCDTDSLILSSRKNTSVLQNYQHNSEFGKGDVAEYCFSQCVVQLGTLAAGDRVGWDKLRWCRPRRDSGTDIAP